MNRIEFRAALAEKLTRIPLAERTKPLDFYDEMICDRVEDGMSESDAVADLGDIDKIAEDILCSMPITSLVKAKVEKSRENVKASSHTALWVALLILGSPVWIPLLLALLGVIFAIFATVWSLIVALFAVVFGFAVAGIAGFFFCFFAGSMPAALFTVGISLVLISLTLFAVPLIILCVKGAVSATKAIVRFIKQQFIK